MSASGKVSETKLLSEFDTVKLLVSIVGQTKGNFGTVTQVHTNPSNLNAPAIYEVEWVDQTRSLVLGRDLRFVPEEEF